MYSRLTFHVCRLPFHVCRLPPRSFLIAYPPPRAASTAIPPIGVVLLSPSPGPMGMGCCAKVGTTASMSKTATVANKAAIFFFMIVVFNEKKPFLCYIPTSIKSIKITCAITYLRDILEKAQCHPMLVRVEFVIKKGTSPYDCCPLRQGLTMSN